MNDLFDDLRWRGLVHQSTDAPQLAAWLASGNRCLYAGIDPTADSLHVGHLVAVMLLRRFQQAGHRPIALVGGATGMIGDPSGKSDERNLLSVETLHSNVAAIEAQLGKFLDFSGASAARLTNNFAWMGNFNYLDFLRVVGKHFPVNVMLAKDSVKDRLEREAGISYTEFSYMLLQAYDFVKLNRDFGCELQVGGSDQWGNITAGIDLARRMHAVQLFGITCPLLLTSEGKKMGKTEQGAIWLSPARTSPYAFYQYWINVADADIGRCLRFLTDLSRDAIEAVETAHAEKPHERMAQRKMAEEITTLVHGKQGLDAAKRATEIFFGAEIESLSDRELSEIFADVPNKQLARSLLAVEGLPLADALVEAGLAKTKSDARRTIEQGGAYVNNRAVTDIHAKLTAAHLASESVMVLRSGKKKYALLRFA